MSKERQDTKKTRPEAPERLLCRECGLEIVRWRNSLCQGCKAEEEEHADTRRRWDGGL